MTTSVGTPAVTTLLVGFDSAWPPTGALVGAIRFNDGTFHGLGTPQIVDYREAEGVILKWQAAHSPTATIVLLDQPTIVRNAAGQRPRACRAHDNTVVTMHQDAFAADYQEEEYRLLGMVIKFAGICGKEVQIVGTNRQTVDQTETTH